MLFEQESVINKIPTRLIETREFVMVGAIASNANMIDISWKNLMELLMVNAEENSIEAQLNIVKEIWTIIDSGHRLRCLLEKLPGIKKKQPWYDLTIRKLKETEEFRHHIQHYDREITNILDNVLPLMGHVSWVQILDDPKKILTIAIVPGALRKFKGLEFVNPLGKDIHAGVNHVTYYVGNLKINLSTLHDRLLEFIPEFEKHIESRIK